MITYHNITMNKAPPQTGWPQMRILFGACNFDVPYPLPRFVQAFVDRINAGMMRTYAVSASGRYTVVLCELFVQRHVQLQMSYILVQMRLLMIPHVGKPRKSVKPMIFFRFLYIFIEYKTRSFNIQKYPLSFLFNIGHCNYFQLIAQLINIIKFCNGNYSSITINMTLYITLYKMIRTGKFNYIINFM